MRRERRRVENVVSSVDARIDQNRERTSRHDTIHDT